MSAFPQLSVRWGQGGAETTSLAVRRVLRHWGETLVTEDRKYGLLPLHTGDLGGIEVT